MMLNPPRCKNCGAEKKTRQGLYCQKCGTRQANCTWTTEQDNLLKTLYATASTAELIKLLGKPESTIYYRAKHFNLYKNRLLWNPSDMDKMRLLIQLQRQISELTCDLRSRHSRYIFNEQRKHLKKETATIGVQVHA